MGTTFRPREWCVQVAGQAYKHHLRVLVSYALLMMSNKTDLTITITPASRRQSSDLAGTSSSPFAKKERVRCMFCGGDQCSKCGINAHQKLEKPGIPNLHSHWINESILAMQRPSDILLEEYGVLESFKRANITAVFNLTEPGEHPYCGPGVLPHSGFPYSPEKLMKAGSKTPRYLYPHQLNALTHSPIRCSYPLLQSSTSTSTGRT